jgi:hypothetical protein
MSLLGAWCNGDRFRQIGCRVRESRAGWHVTAHERQRSENLLRENGAEIIHGTGSFIDCHTVEVRGFIWPGGASSFVASQFFLELEITPLARREISEGHRRPGFFRGAAYPLSLTSWERTRSTCSRWASTAFVLK